MKFGLRALGLVWSIGVGGGLALGLAKLPFWALESWQDFNGNSCVSRSDTNTVGRPVVA